MSDSRVVFDKTKLKMNEFLPFIGEISFAGKKRKVLVAAGYIHAARPYIQKMEIVTAKTIPYNDIVRAEVLVRVTLIDGTVWEAAGDADSADVKDEAALLRYAETRAINRALSRALNINFADLNDESEPVEDEAYTPLDRDRSEVRRGSYTEPPSGKGRGISPDIGELPVKSKSKTAPQHTDESLDW